MQHQSDEQLEQYLDACQQAKLSLRSGSPSDRTIVDGQLADLALTAIPELVEQVRQLRAATYPDKLTPELDHVLGWPNFQCGPYANMFRAAGHVVPTKAEREQAFILHWLVKLVLKHGSEWTTYAQQDLEKLTPPTPEAQ